MDHQKHELEERPQSRREWSGWLPSIVLPLGLVVVIVAGLLYFESSGGGGGSGDSGFGTVALPAALNPTGEAPAARVGRAAPDFLLASLAGDDLRFSDLRGQPLIANFFATWCTSCRYETPDLITFYEAHRDAGLVLLGIDLQESSDLVQRHTDEFGITYPIVLDSDGEVSRTWQIGGPSQGVPSTYFIDGSGVVQKIVFGSIGPEELAEGLDLISARVE
jgi:peroxiredoxin